MNDSFQKWNFHTFLKRKNHRQTASSAEHPSAEHPKYCHAHHKQIRRSQDISPLALCGADVVKDSGTLSL